MKIKQKNNLLILVFFINIFFFSNNLYSENFLKKNTYNIKNNKKINISKKSMERILGYLNGNFYSENLNKTFYQVSGIYFALSKDGNNTSISFCNADAFNLCAEQMLVYQTLNKCEKISNQKCYLIYRGKTFLPLRKKNINLTNYFLVNNNFKGNHSDIYGKTLEEFHDAQD